MIIILQKETLQVCVNNTGFVIKKKNNVLFENFRMKSEWVKENKIAFESFLRRLHV